MTLGMPVNSAEEIFGVVTTLIGATLFFWRGKRKFDRINTFTGVEQFQSYLQKIGARIWDSILMLVATIILTVGVITLAVVHESTWGWIVLLPCYVFFALAFLGFPFGPRK